MDCVFAGDTAHFITPFTSLAIVPECCSSYTFPLILGPSLANQMLMFNYKLSAREARERGLIAAIHPRDTLRCRTNEWLRQVGESAVTHSVIAAKMLIRNAAQRELLHRVNREEFEVLRATMQRPEFRKMIDRFLNKNKTNA